MNEISIYCNAEIEYDFDNRLLEIIAATVALNKTVVYVILSLNHGLNLNLLSEFGPKCIE